MNIKISKVILSVMVLILIGLPGTTSLAAEEPSAGLLIGGDDEGYSSSGLKVNIVPWNKSDYYINMNTQSGITRFGWSACGKGLANDAVDASSVYLVVKKNGIVKQKIGGTSLKSKNRWKSPVVDYKYPLVVCGWNAPQIWRTHWVHNNYPFDKAGTYTVKLVWKFLYQVSDGFATYNPPAVNTYEGTYKSGTTTVHVTK
ncbi:MAG: hypothetical protein N2D54_09370 [Chloroflexota bacterium]